ncbi:DUF58 domain-containing protein [Eubacterium sp. 1001713B170207_170306_E7]|uniref:DUF58 domain-containing protein n=1 Tax=Eubacterium sp. 1001713B170207_170306_E7 TaxID=2787097 RepID=UPI0018985255|nr:DUF58 domain-containing protein [Eubacterium sp. 1001713B170207_170306_E7]
MKKQRFSYFLFLMAALVFLVYYPGYISHLLFIVMLVLPFFSLLSVLPAYFDLEFDLTFESADAAKHEDIPYALTIRNTSYFPCAYVCLILFYENVLGSTSGSGVLELTKSIAPLETAVLHSKLSFQYCGKIRLFVEKAKVYDPLRLFALPVRPKSLSGVGASVYIMPNICESDYLKVPAGYTDSDQNTHALWKAGYDPGDIFQLRDYRAGDRVQKIHWKLSQRLDTLIVKDFSLSEDYYINFLIDFGKKTTIEAIDRILDAFATVSASCLEQQIPFTVTWLEKELLITETVTETEAFVPVLYCLLEAQATEQHEVIRLFDSAAPEHAGGYLIAVMDGTIGDPARDRMAADCLSAILQKKQYRSITALMAGPNPELVKALRASGCAVFTLEDNIGEKEGRRE